MSTALEKAEAALKQAVDYVGRTQPLLDKQAAERDAYVSDVQATVDHLIHAGAINPSRRVALVDKLASDPLELCAFVREFGARTGTPQSLGTPSAQHGDKEASIGGYARDPSRPMSLSDKSVLFKDPNAQEDDTHMGDGTI